MNMKSETNFVKCPTCQRLVEWRPDNLYRPFCSKRCQLIDLGEWANESHRIPANPIIEDDWLGDEETNSFHDNHDN